MRKGDRSRFPIPYSRSFVSVTSIVHHKATVSETRGPSFARGLWRIASADVSSGNKIRLLHDGPDTFDEMIELIHNATKSVALESYIVRSDEVGDRLAAALIDASKRGVDVRVVTDRVGTRGTTQH